MYLYPSTAKPKQIFISSSNPPCFWPLLTVLESKMEQHIVIKGKKERKSILLRALSVTCTVLSVHVNTHRNFFSLFATGKNIVYVLISQSSSSSSSLFIYLNTYHYHSLIYKV